MVDIIGLFDLCACRSDLTGGFRRLKAYKQLPKLRDALIALKAERAATLANLGETA